MKRGWIKLHRTTLDNKIWQRDPTAWHIFEYFLLSVDKDTHKRTFGRKQLARELEMNESTVYKALKRLENAKMVTQVSNNRFTTILILNWRKYQGNGNTSREQQSNNKVTLNKNKRIREYNTTYSVVEKELLEFLKTQEKIKNPEAYLNWLIKNYGRGQLARLKTIEFPKWIENLEHWRDCG